MSNGKKGRVILENTPEEDERINAGIAADPDNPEWTAADFAAGKPASKFFDKETFEQLVAMKRPRGRPPGSVSANTKVSLTMRFDPDVVQAMRETGPGWQTRLNELLRREYVDGRAKQAAG